MENIYKGHFCLCLPKAYNKNENENALIEKGKKDKKRNIEINEIVNSISNNLFHYLQNKVNLIFINSKYANLVPGQGIQEENNDFSDSDDDSESKKRKVKRIPKRKKKSSKNKPIKYFGNSWRQKNDLFEI